VTVTTNGEIWYKILAEYGDMTNPIGCSPEDRVEGWIVGKLKTGMTVELNEINPIQTDNSGNKQAEVETESEEYASLNIVSYALLIVGTLLAVIIVDIEKAKRLKPSMWFTPITIFRFVVLTFLNITFSALFLDAFLKVSETSLIVKLFEILSDTVIGFVFLGFAISLVLLKFVSFAENKEI